MTAWPSQSLGTTRPAKGKPAPTMRTDWGTGWLVALFALVAVAVVAVMLWPVAVTALDSIATITRTLGGA